MDMTNAAPKKSNVFIRLFSTLDSFYTKFFGSLLILAFARNAVKKFLLKSDDISASGQFLLIVVAILIAILWTRLSEKVNLSLYEIPLPANQKKRELLLRGIWIFLYYNLAKSIKTLPKFNVGIGVLIGSLYQLFLVFGLIVLLISIVVIFLRPAFSNRYITKPHRSKTKESAEKRIRKAGKQGEKEVAYALSWLDDDYKVFNNIYLEYNGQVQEFDHIVVGQNGIFNIETKNLIGNIIIDDGGNWIREKDGQREGTKNPLFQVKRHRKVLSGIIEKKYPIVDVVALANEKTIITGADNSPIHIIKVDMLQYFIEEYSSSKFLSKDQVTSIITSIEKSLKRNA